MAGDDAGDNPQSNESIPPGRCGDEGVDGRGGRHDVVATIPMFNLASTSFVSLAVSVGGGAAPGGTPARITLLAHAAESGPEGEGEEDKAEEEHGGDTAEASKRPESR